MSKRKRIEPLPGEPVADEEEPCEECAAGYRKLMIITAATTFVSAIAVVFIAFTAWLAWEARCG
jgi:hypothetical protein